MTRYIPEINAVGLTTRKALGEAAEAAFLAKATSLGFGVAKTWGDSERYDFILDSGKRLWRVQVKSSRRSDGSRYIVKLKGAAAYTAKEIDFIVAYIVPENLLRDSHFCCRTPRPDVRFSPRHPPFQA